MQDKIYNISSAMFNMLSQDDKFVIHDGTTWVLDEQRYMNYCGLDMANRGVNMMRWLLWNVWAHMANPPWNPTYPGVDNAHNLTPFKVSANGLFILSEWNEKYFEILERMIQIANYPSQKPGNTAPGITPAIDLAYQYTNDINDKRGSPWRNNIIGTTDLYDPRNWPYFEALMLRIFALRKKIHPMTGQPLRIEIGMGNEMGGESIRFCARMLRVMDREKVWPFSWAIGPEIPSPDGNDLFKALPKIIMDENLFRWYPLRNREYWDSSVIRPVHGCGIKINGIDVFEYTWKNWAFLPIRWKISDDGDMGPEGKPGAEWWYALVRRICTERNGQALTLPWDVDKPMLAIEHLPDDEQWDASREKQLGVQDAIARAYAETFDPFENFGRWPDKWVNPLPPIPPEPPIPPTPPTPVKPPFSLRGEWNNNKGKILLVIGAIVIFTLIAILMF